METVQHVSPGMPTQAQLSYAPRPTLQYSLSNPASLPLGGSGSFKVSSAQNTSIPYPSYPGSGELSSRYVQPSSQYNSSDRPSSNSTSSYSENNHSSSVIGRGDRNSTSNSSLGEYMPPKSRAVLNSDHRSSHPSNRINSADSYPESILNTAYHVDHGAPPNKRIKYNEAVKPELQQPLRVDTSERPVYNPPVEAISPTLPPQPPPPPPAPPPNTAQNANSPETSAATAAEANDKQDEAVINVDSYSCSNNPTELVDLLTKIEDEIRKTDQQIQQLKKKQKEMEENTDFANAATIKVEPECEEIILPKLIQVAKRIYDENWDKANISHQFFIKFGALEDLPVYNQAPDTEIYHENKKKYAELKPFLIDKIRKEKQAKEARDQNIALTYNKMSTEWKRKLEKIENSQKRKARDLKNREVFEKVFPELRKQREDKERFSRSGGRVRSEADLEEIMDGLQEQELEDKKMRSYAVIPPLMLDSKQRRYSFINNNGLITDLPKVAKENEYYNIWTESEKEIFKEKFLQHPKNFGVIASYLEKKTVCECVAYYYHSKKTEHYKRLLRKSRRTRARNLQGKASGANASGLANPGDILYNNTPGVTTRLQREQIQQQQRLEQPQNLSVAATSTTSSNSTTSMAGSSTSATAASTAAAASTSTTTATTAVSTTSTTVTESTPMDTSSTSTSIIGSAAPAESSVEISTTTYLNGAEASTAAVAATTTSGVDNCSVTGGNAAGSAKTAGSESVSSDVTDLTPATSAKVVPDTVLDGRSAISPVSPAGNTVNNDAVKSETKPDIKKKERRKDDKKKNDTNTQVGDTSEEDTLPSESNDKGTTHPCLVCKTDAVSSRALPRSHAQQYGLREDEVTPGARVCNLCRCKAVRSRYMHCPLPTCPNTKGNRVKRLRTLPCKWADLPVHIKQPVIAEFQIPSTATKCCSACFNRIQRRLVQMGVVASQGDDTSTSPTSSSQLTKWTDEETESLKRAIAEHGTKWSEVSQMVGSSKTQFQCKAFYFNYRRKLGLDAAMQEYNKKHFGEERKPTLSTDEEESGSTTSSCDELDRSVPDDSDTASAPSPAMNNDTSGGIGSAVITKTPMMNDMQMDTSSINTSATAISNLPGSTSPLKCTPPVISHLISKEDYDSSATETADEGVGVGADNENTSSFADHVGKSNLNSVGGDREKVAMVDVIGGLIEFQLNKPSQVPGLSQAPNSISSIVDQNLFECDQRQQKARENSLATLSLVSSVHHPGHSESMKDGVVYLQMPGSKESPRDHETGTLDLSMKKPRSPEFVNNHMVHNTQSVHPSAVSKNSNSHPHTPLIPVPPHQPHVYKHPAPHEPANSSYYHHQQQLVEVGRVTKTGEPLYWKVPPLVMPHNSLITVKQPPTHPKLLNKVSSPQQLNQNIKLSPKQSPNGVSSSAGLNISLNQQSKLGGSIMHGTPVSSANLYPSNVRDGRYDAPLLRQITPPSHQGSPLIKETGSITQGTPVHQRGSSHSNSSAEYYPQSNSKRSSSIPTNAFYPNRPHSYNDEQRQHIIMADFLTSQQLSSMKESVQPRDNKSYYYQARQGVIQRHNTNPPGTPISKSVSPHPYPPGHEALGSLVDVAIQQPSLPVPLSHSAPGSNVVGQHKGDKQRLIIQEGLGDRFSRDAIPKERYLSREEVRESEQQRYSRQMPPQLHHQGPLPPSHHDQPPPPMSREHQLTAHQLRENHLQREREQRQQELRDQQLHQHYREQQKLREQEQQRMIRDQQGKHREMLSQMPPSIRDQHMQPPPHLQQQQQQQQHQSQQQREIESNQYQRSGSANSRLGPESQLPPHTRIQQIPPSIYQPHRVHSNPPEQSIDSRMTSTINYHREPTPVTVKVESGRESARPRQGDSSTVTAASLIDAIITHQINQPSDTAVSATASQDKASPHVPSTRPGDKLFQVFPEPDGKLSPLKCGPTMQSRASPDVKSQPPQLQPQQPTPQSIAHHQQQQQQQQQQQHSLPVSSAGGVHGDSGGSRDGGLPPRSIGPPILPPSSSSQSHVYVEPQAWKLRRALQQKELEQQQSSDRNIVRIAGAQRPLSPREKLGGLQSNPLDYVRNKIVEEMHRTSDDEGGAKSSGGGSNHGSSMSRSDDNNSGSGGGGGGSNEQPNQPSYLPASNYAYPYSALNINSQVPVSAHTTPPAAPPKPVDVPEPTPILSSQYEPLSDED